VTPTGLIVDGKPIRPWRRSCWDEDGHPVEHGPDCWYHDQWARITSDNAFVAWVEPGPRGRFKAYAWDPALEDHVELCRWAGTYGTRWSAKRGADRALTRFVRAYKKEHTT
jgi:hypothetical protein